MAAMQILFAKSGIEAHGNLRRFYQQPHRYFFKLYALDKMLDLKPGACKEDVEHAMQGHILAKAELMGTYRR
jgi:phosphatidylethanolamine-binding protein (PEBP) family uncharacterized protein